MADARAVPGLLELPFRERTLSKIMGFGNLIKSIFGGSGAGEQGGQGAEETSEPLEYKGLTIEAAPIKEGGQYRTAGYISGAVDGDESGEIKRVQFIRADNSNDRQAAIDHSVSKAKQIIDEQGNKLLEKPHL